MRWTAACSGYELIMDNQRDLILKSFLAESEEGLSDLEQGILQLESNGEDRELVQTIFRAVHTMKGNASILDLHSLLSFTHAMEDLLDAVRNGKVAVTAELTDILLASAGILRQMVFNAAQGVDETSDSAKNVMQSLLQFIESAPCKSPAELTATPEPSGSTKRPEKQVMKTLRVEVEKLDRLLNLAGEITIARGRITQILESTAKTSLAELREAHDFAESLHLELREAILQARMVPLGPLFRQYAPKVRDLARAHGKCAELQIVGEDVEVDTSVVEHLRDPLLHMIRNALDHGIETPAERERCGKPTAGTITVRAAHDGGNVAVDVSDDGKGLDREQIIDAAKQRGIVRDFENLPAQDLFQIIFEPGFSTASEITDLSGRGVGMDVVRRNVEALRGTVSVSSQPGSGSTVSIRLPLTLAIIEGFGVDVGDETYVIPMDHVIECLAFPKGDYDSTRSDGVLQLRGSPLPFLFLSRYFGVADGNTDRRSIVVVRHDSGRAGLVVDALLGAMQTVIKPLPILTEIPGISGTAILGNGKVALIVDVSALLRDFQSQLADMQPYERFEKVPSGQ